MIRKRGFKPSANAGKATEKATRGQVDDQSSLVAAQHALDLVRHRVDGPARFKGLARAKGRENLAQEGREAGAQNCV
jgi:hypothetical protein